MPSIQNGLGRATAVVSGVERLRSKGPYGMHNEQYFEPQAVNGCTSHPSKKNMRIMPMHRYVE